MEPSVRPTYPARISRLPSLLGWLVLLMLILLAPTLAEQIQFAITRGELRARSEAAAAELTQLDKTAELVKLSDTSRAFRLVAKTIEPSVVHIDTEQITREQATSTFDEWGGLLGGQPRERTYRAVGQGSGIIVDKAGYIITNFHVIQDARRIDVKLSDGRTITGGDIRVIGYDVLTDLAVLKINAGELITAPWGDSKQLEVGDWVLAIGNPYGLDRTVTAGIVSAKQRRGVSENTAYQDFLQTDAAVNPGNSGGPLVNIQGQVIGITTAIVGNSYQGISFAIPTEIVHDVYERLITKGKVARGYLGVGLQEITPEIAQQLKLGESHGVVVTGIQQGSPAAKAGLEPGDVITDWDGQKVIAPDELRRLVAGAKIGSKVEIKVIREGRTRSLEVTIGERDEAH
jgi:serine protease Do